MSSPPPRSESLKRIAGLAALAACLLLYLLFGPVALGTFATKTAGESYSSLSDSFLSGQTYLKLKPDPALKLLANPWAGAQGIPRLHDATYFHDRYYLYFSFVPVILVGIPFHLLTGWFLTDEATTFLCAILGFLLGSLFFLRIWRLWFQTLPGAWLALGVLLVGLGNHLVILVQSNTVYPVPISCAAACLMAAFYALTQALAARSARTRLFALALASLAWGLAVGCRPNYFFSLLVFGVIVGFFIVGAARRRGFFCRETLAEVAAVILPAASIGAAIVAYNYSRFGSVTEFGTTYQFAGSDQRSMPMFALGHIWVNIATYLFHPDIHGPYFPYVIMSVKGFGVLTRAPLVGLGLAWPLTLFHPPFRRDPLWIFLGATLLLTFLANLVSVSLLPTANERYLADFLPTAILLGVITAGGLVRWWQECRASGWALAVGRSLFFAAAVWTIGYAGLLLFVHADPLEIRSVTRFANQFTWKIERWRGVEFGPATARVKFPHQAPGKYEPLLVTGGGRDILYVVYLEHDRIQVGFHHLGAGGPVSEPVAIEPGKEYTLTLNLGSLYPPAEHPLVSDWPELQLKRLRRQLDVSLDNHQLIKTGSEFYPTHPWDIAFGKNPGPLIAHGNFTGTMGPVVRAGLPSPIKLGAHDANGAVRMTVRFPPFDVFKSEPLVSTGHTGAGELLYVTYVAPGRIRFGHDSWGSGAIETDIVSYEPNTPQTLEVDLPSLSGKSKATAQSFFILRYNGSPLTMGERPYQETDSSELFFGFNGCDSTAASMVFSGKIEAVERIGKLVVPLEKFQQGFGPMRLTLRLPSNASGRKEPLVSTGRTGAADLIYVEYVDESHVRFGFDHWSVGGPVSAVFPVDYAATHVIEVQMGSLYPADGDTAWGPLSTPKRETLHTAVIVQLDGQVVLTQASPAYPSLPEQIQVGQNNVKASSCAADFTGRILLRERMGLKSVEP